MKKSRKIILIVASILMLISILVIIGIIWGMNKVNFKGLDEANLGINEEMYNGIPISKEEYDSINNVLLIASDSENGYDKEKHADVIMILSVNQNKKTVKMISIPRDVYVDIEGYKKYKLNKSYSVGEEQLLVKTLNLTFGLNITEYVTIDFTGFTHIINDIGGIELEISEAEKNYINQYSNEAYRVSKNSYKMVPRSGKVTLSGEQAVTHARNRTTANDIARTSKHRDVMTATMNKIANMESDKILGLVNSLLKQVKTNINVMKYTGILTNILYDRSTYMNNITSVLVPSMDYSKGINLESDGAYVIETDIEKAKEDFIKYMYLT